MKKGISTPVILISLLIIGILVGGAVFLLFSSKPQIQNTVDQGQPATSAVEEPVEKIVAKVFPNNNVPSLYSERYLDYTSDAYTNLKNNRRVLFFAASWCPTCQAANQAFLSKLAEIPSDVSVFIVNYDEEIEMKAKYNIIYQHTFVQVDQNGNEITKWNGGDTEELLSSLN